MGRGHTAGIKHEPESMEQVYQYYLERFHRRLAPSSNTLPTQHKRVAFQTPVNHSLRRVLQ